MTMDLIQLGQTVLAALLSIVAIFLLTKLMGTKQVSQMTMFDYVVGITIGSIAAELATELEDPVRPLAAMIVYGFTAVGISVLTNKSIRLRTAVTGKPLVLLENGVIYRENLKKARLDLHEFLTYCRIGGWFDLNQLRTAVTGKPLVLLENGVIYRENLKKARLDLHEFLTYCRIGGWFDLNQLQSAVLEHNGVVSFLPKETERPATPSDLNLHPAQSSVQIPFVMDGVLLADNVRQAGKEESWVRRSLLRQGYQDAADVLLALWDGGEKLTVFPMKP